MYELVNATISICRGTETGPYGEVTNAGEPYYTGVPAAMAETSRTVMDPASQTPRTIRTTTCVLPASADVLDSDTIVDERNGQAYMVESLQLQPTLGAVAPDKILTLRWRSGYSAYGEHEQG